MSKEAQIRWYGIVELVYSFHPLLQSAFALASRQLQQKRLFFASAGHAALYDYPQAKGLQAIALDIWERGGILGAVCHGPVLLPPIIDPKTGESIIAGKTVTGFTTDGEMVLNVLDRLKSDGVSTVLEAVSKARADYSSPMSAFDDYSVTAGRIITGTNPASARSAAERTVRAFDKPAEGLLKKLLS